MTQVPALPDFANWNLHFYTKARRGQTRLTLALAALLTTLCAPPLWAAPVAGDTFVYRVINGYNHEAVGYVRHDIAPQSTAQGTVDAVTVDQTALGMTRTEIYTPDGLWLRRPLDNHGMPVEYEFSPGLPAEQAPPSAGSSWSVRVNAKVPGDAASRSVRIDAAVLGNERITVPAGAFDTIKIRRTIYAGDAGSFQTETRIMEFDWYAPALGRSVRTETRSTWRALPGCRRGYCDHRGDWFIYELGEARPAAK